MKLLLTSAGITNQSIKEALIDLVRKTPRSTKIGFIPTAANVGEGHKDWFITQLDDLRRYGYEWIDIIDPSANNVDWRTRVRDLDVIYVSGGNTFHLLDQFRATGFDRWLIQVAREKVYIGASAGSIVATPTIEAASIPGDINIPKLTNLRGLRLVDFELVPHCDIRQFALVEEYAAVRSRIVYALDDETAIKVVDGVAEVVSEGKWRLFSNK